MKPEQLEAIKRLDERLANMSQDELDEMNAYIDEQCKDIDSPSVNDLFKYKLLQNAVDLAIEAHCLPQFRNEPDPELKYKIIEMVLDSGNSYLYEHLGKVVQVAEKFIYYIDEENRMNVLASCWLHDSIEDGRLTYNDIKKRTNEEVAEIVYRLTNFKGKTRKERANDEYYQMIKEHPLALFVKLCDRISNVEDSLNSDIMLKKYKEEYSTFKDKLLTNNYPEMWELLDKYLQ